MWKDAAGHDLHPGDRVRFIWASCSVERPLLGCWGRIARLMKNGYARVEFEGLPIVPQALHPESLIAAALAHDPEFSPRN